MKLPLAWAALCAHRAEPFDEPLGLAAQHADLSPGFRERSLAEYHGPGPVGLAPAWAEVGRALRALHHPSSLVLGGDRR